MKRMNVGLVALFCLIIPLVHTGARAQGGGTPATEIPAKAAAIATDKIKDMTATLVVQDVNRDELGKMGGSFGASIQYSIKRMSVFYAYPNKARFEGKFLGSTVLMVYNGDKKMFKIPLHSETQDIHGHPGQKQTLMDLGIFARDYLTTDYLPTYLRTENGLEVYKLSQRFTTNTSHEIVWVNPKTAIIEKRLSYNGDNILQKELRYKNPLQVRPGIFVPTVLEIYNQEGKLAASQSIEEIKVNLGVDDIKFQI